MRIYDIEVKGKKFMNKSANEVLELLKNRYKDIQLQNDLSEEKIKIDIVRDFFLREMGYDILKITYAS